MYILFDQTPISQLASVQSPPVFRCHKHIQELTDDHTKYIARDNYTIPYIVIEPPVGLTLDEAAEYMTEKVIKYVKAVKMLHQ